MKSHPFRTILCSALLLAVAPLAPGAEGPSADEFEPSPLLETGWYVRIETSMGRIVAKLLPAQAPQSVAHFAGLASGTLAWTDMVTGETKEAPYYDGMPVHTVLAGRLFESGDAASRGGTMPMLYVPPSEGGAPINFSRPYVMGMSRLGGDRISGAMFFITAAPQRWLTGDYPCFGEVLEGQEVVFNISQAKAYPSGRPIDPILIEKMVVFAVGDPQPLPEPDVYEPKLIEIEFAGDQQDKPD